MVENDLFPWFQSTEECLQAKSQFLSLSLQNMKEKGPWSSSSLDSLLILKTHSTHQWHDYLTLTLIFLVMRHSLTILQENLYHNWKDFDEQGLPSIDSKFPSCKFWPLVHQWVNLVPVLNDELWNIWRHLKYLLLAFATSE